MDDGAKLYLLNLELDNTDPDGPNRNKRRKLNRERGRILCRLGGKDPMHFATGRLGCTAPEGPERNRYLMKKTTIKLLTLLEAK